MAATAATAHQNRLAQEASPYLLQHQHNPVDWWPWNPDALAEAKRANKPILLSVGYAACHWCHVMAHESFEDDDTAKVMNDLFVNIKVDREERPDIDQIYMAALHLMGEHGGWPLTMFLTPAGEPFWGGTYFPKVEPLRQAGLCRCAARSRARVPRGAEERRAEPLSLDGTACGNQGAARQGHHGALAARSIRRAARRTDRPGAWRHSRRAEIPQLHDAGISVAGRGADGGEPLLRRGRDHARSASARAASTIISAADSPATQSTNAGWCRISRRCCTTTRSSWNCSRSRISVPAIRFIVRARRRPSAGCNAR